ncbi:SHF protein, partial [Psilopogon haemacephalus]|nr:SHF protein [Psilopogon haemacephalus]
LYDTPNEDWETAGEGPGVATPRASRLPRHDERPADEYDQPWEWKKDHISRAFAGDSQPGLLGAHPSCPHPVPLSTNPALLSPPPASAGATLSPPPSQHPPAPMGASLKPGVTVARHRWYHGPIGRAGAETLLALCREGSFLVRDCETSPDDYSLSLRSSHGFVHVKLTRTREQHFTLGRAGAAFPSVPAAVRHYTARALPVRGARHLSLLYPVAVQPL